MSERDYRAQQLTDRYLLLHVNEANIYTSEERKFVSAYRKRCRKLEVLESKLRELRSKSLVKKLSLFEARKCKRLEEKLRVGNNYLLLDECEPCLRVLIERERTRSIVELDKQHSKTMEELKQRQIQEVQEQRRRYDAERTKATAMQEIRKLVLIAMNASDEHITDIGKLALATIMAVMRTHNRDDKSYVCRTNLASCDTVIYSAFLVRVLALSQATNEALARHFTEEFVYHLTYALNNLFPLDNIDIKTMFDSRMMLYERVFVKKQGIENRLQAVTEEFELVLKTDALRNCYVEFNENSPLPILGIEADMKCSSDAAEYFNELLTIIDKDLEVVQQRLKR